MFISRNCWLTVVSMVLCFSGLPLKAQEEAKPVQKDANAEKIKRDFEKRYALPAGVNLKRIAPPFPELRVDYYDLLYSGQGRSFIERSLKSLTFKQKGDRLTVNSGHFGGDRFGVSLSTLLTSLVGLYPQELEGKKELLETFVEGDFVARDGVPTDQLIAALETILREECKTTLKLRLIEVERDVVVARGRYQFRPGEPGKMAIEVYGQELVPNSGAGGGSGSFEEMLQWVGRFTEPNKRVINEVKDAPKQVEWRLHERSPSSEETRAQDHDVVLVFEHLGDQTGLTFKFESRKVRVLSIEQAETERDRRGD